MEIIKEITEWVWPNHIYLLDDKGYLIAYVKAGQEELNRVSRVPFSKTGRKFVEDDIQCLVEYGLMYNAPIVKSPVELTFPSWTVDGSKGNTYIVELIGDKYHCNCAGYGFRGKCRHSEQIKEAQEK